MKKQEILKLPLEVRAEMALKSAVRKMMEERAREGRSIFVWKEGRVVEITAKELRKKLRAKRRVRPTSKRSA
jgi:hypothetical protein